MKRPLWIYLLLIVLILPAKVEAQRWRLQRYEAIIGAGSVHPFVDIGSPASGLPLQLKGTRPNASIGARYLLFENLSLGVDMYYLRIADTDWENRLSVHTFRTNAFEHSFTVQYSLISKGKMFRSRVHYNRRGMINNYGNTDIYFFGGVGGLLSKSNAFDVNNEKILDNPYFNNKMHYGVVFPAGIGVKVSISSYWTFAAELGGRYTFNDLIDGYSTPFSNYDDRYILTSFRAIYKIANDSRNKPKLF